MSARSPKRADKPATVRKLRHRGRKLSLLVAGGLVVIVLAGFAFIYFVLFPTSSPPRLHLPGTTNATPVASGTSLTGAWTIANGSVAGYRVREKLGFLPAESDAVGRTSQITGRASVTESSAGVSITAASFRVAVNTLKSDEAMRDQHIRTIGLQSDLYPNATFVLSDPLTLPASALSGHVVDASVTGVFNIHGTARRETVPLQIQLSGEMIQATGSLTFPWSRFNMTAPSVGGFVNVSGKATMEFDLRLRRS